MTQFVTLTTTATSEKMRVNVEAIIHYVRDPADKTTEVLLSNGGLLKVKEGLGAIDDLIRNKESAAVLSADK